MKLGKGEKIWTRVEIDDKELRKAVKRDSVAIINEISDKLSADDLTLLGQGIQSTRPLTIASGLQEILDNSFDSLVDIYCAYIFAKSKGRAIDEIARTVFPSTSKIDVNAIGHIALVIKMLEKNPMLIFDVYLRNQVINRGFDRYSLVSKKKSRPKIPLEDLDEVAVNNYLKTVDSKIKDGKKSMCWHITHHGDETELYVRREDKPILMKKLTDNISEVIANSTIFRFDKYGRKVDMWSENDAIAHKLLNHLAERIYSKDASYLLDVYQNNPTSVKTWLETIISDQDKEMKLLKIQRTNTPIEGNPKITIESTTPIGKTLEALNQLGIDMKADCAYNTEEVKIRFKQKNYFIGLDVSGEAIVMFTKWRKGTSSVMKDIDAYMRKNYELKLSLGR